MEIKRKTMCDEIAELRATAAAAGIDVASISKHSPFGMQIHALKNAISPPAKPAAVASAPAKSVSAIAAVASAPVATAAVIKLTALETYQNLQATNTCKAANFREANTAAINAEICQRSKDEFAQRRTESAAKTKAIQQAHANLK